MSSPKPKRPATGPKNEENGRERPKKRAEAPTAPPPIEAGRSKMVLGGAAMVAAIGAVAIWQVTSKPTATTSPSASAPSRPMPPSAAASTGTAPSAAPRPSAAPVAAEAPATLKVEWTRAYGTSAIESLKGIAAGRSGVYGAVDSLGADGKRDGAIVALSPTGELQWEIAIENDDDLDLRAIGVAGDRVVVAGFFEKDVTVQEKKVTTPAKLGIFTAELAASTGKLQSLHAYGGEGLSLLAGRLAITVDDAGLVLGGAFGGKLDLGCGEKEARGLLDGFVARLDAKGKCAFMRRLGDAERQTVESVAVESSGDIAIAGELSGVIDFGESAHTPEGRLVSEGGVDLFVAKLDPKGEHKWSRRFGSKSSFGASARVAAHALGAVVLAGWFGGTVDFGAGPLTAAGAHDLVVARFSPTGELEFSRQIKTSQGRCDAECDPDWIGLATNDRGDALVALPFEGTIDLGDGSSLTSAGASDLALVDLDTKGATVGAVRLGDAAAQCPPFQCRLGTAAIGPTFYAGGLFQGRLDAELEAVAGDAFLLRLGD